MDNILNSKMKECYSITGEVVVEYYELYEIMMQYAMEDTSVYESYISDVLELVIKEYDMYRSLTLSDINMCLKSIENIDCDSSMIDARFKRKLQTLRDVYEGFKIDTEELKLDFINKDMEFTLFISLSSLIDIEVMKRLRKKLDVISTTNYNDLMFIQALYRQFNSIIFSQTFSNNLTEAINLSCKMDVDTIPKVDINILIDKINGMFGINNDNYFKPVDVTLMEIARITVDRLVEVNFENNPKVVFNNLLFITRLEVLIPYMNKDSLHNLLNYCEMVRTKNSFGVDNAMVLIKEKLK